MSFKKDFPELNITNLGDLMNYMTNKNKNKCIQKLKEYYTKVLTKGLGLEIVFVEDIQTHCLSKKKVSDAIEKLEILTEELGYAVSSEELKKELNL